MRARAVGPVPATRKMEPLTLHQTVQRLIALEYGSGGSLRFTQ
jgi:hypothetical protein